MSRLFMLTIASLCVTSAWAATAGSIVEYAAPSGTPSATPPSPYTDAQFLYQYFVPKADDPQQTPLYYRLYVPPSYATSGSAKHPLVIFLHGDGETEQTNPPRNQKQLTNNGQYAFCSSANQAQFPCFFAMVQTAWWGRDTGTKTGSDMATALAAKYRIDADRIIVTGLSGGGGATQSWVGNQPGTYAGFVALSAPTPQAAGSFKPAGLATVPSWLFGSEGDSQDCNTFLATTMRSYGAYTMNTRYANGGHSANTWSAAYNTPALVPWLASLRRGQMATHPVEVTITAPTSANVYATSATTIKPAGTTLDRQYGGAASGITAVNWSIKGGSSLATTGGTASWSASAAGSLPSGDGYVSATATCGSWNSARGGVTYVSDVLRIQRTATNTAPTISTIANQSLAAGAKTGALAFTVADSETAAASLTVTATSANTVLVPASGIALGGSGGSRTITVTPATGVSGSAVITVKVSDGSLTASRSFTVAVAAATNTAPTISTIANQSLAAGAKTGALAFTVADSETAAASLTVTATSANTALVPASGIALGGSGGSRTITVTPAAGASGSASITVTVSDGSLNASTTFTVTVASTPQASGTFTTQYYPSIDLSGTPITTTTPIIDFDWGSGSPAGMPVNSFSARWSGTAVPSSSGLYTIACSSDDGCRVWFDGVLLIDFWSDHAASERSTTIQLTAGTPVAVRMEYYEHAGSASAHLTWSGPGVAKQPIPAASSANPQLVLDVDFGSPGSITSGHVNNITDSTAGRVAGAVATDGSSTGVAVAITGRFTYLGTGGMAVAGPFPASAQGDFFYIDSGRTAMVTISGLDASQTYDLAFFASRDANDNRTTTYTINGASQSVNAAGNTSSLVTFAGIAPTGGAIAVRVAAGSGSAYGYLNALRLSSHEATPTAIAAVAATAIQVDPPAASTATGDGSGGCGAGSIAGLCAAGIGLGLRRRRRH